MLSINNPMQFNHLESILPLDLQSLIPCDRWIITVLLLFEQLNKKAFDFMKEILGQDVTPQN